MCVCVCLGIDDFGRGEEGVDFLVVEGVRRRVLLPKTNHRDSATLHRRTPADNARHRAIARARKPHASPQRPPHATARARGRAPGVGRRPCRKPPSPPSPPPHTNPAVAKQQEADGERQHAVEAPARRGRTFAQHGAPIHKRGCYYCTAPRVVAPVVAPAFATRRRAGASAAQGLERPAAL